MRAPGKAAWRRRRRRASKETPLVRRGGVRRRGAVSPGTGCPTAATVPRRRLTPQTANSTQRLSRTPPPSPSLPHLALQPSHTVSSAIRAPWPAAGAEEGDSCRGAVRRLPLKSPSRPPLAVKQASAGPEADFRRLPSRLPSSSSVSVLPEISHLLVK